MPVKRCDIKDCREYAITLYAMRGPDHHLSFCREHGQQISDHYRSETVESPSVSPELLKGMDYVVYREIYVAAWKALRQEEAELEEKVNNLRSQINDEIDAARADLKERLKQDEREAHLGTGSLVYYIGWKGHDQIKIGVTQNLKQRLKDLKRAGGREPYVICTEPGGYALERQRHHQFRHLRTLGTELFDWSPLLAEHCETLRAAMG